MNIPFTSFLLVVLSNFSRQSRAFSVSSFRNLHSPRANTIMFPRIQSSCSRKVNSSWMKNYNDPVTVTTATTSTDKTRLYSSFRGGNDEEEGFLSKIANKAKSVLPFLKSEKETKAAIERKQVKNEVKGGIDTMLKDAPLGVRMMGKMIAPIIGSVASNLAEAAAEQGRQMEELLNEAQTLIMLDDQAVQLLGEPIQVGSPFSQSSSTTTINGKTTKNIQASFQVGGSYGSGIATMVANEAGISNLTLQAGGRSFGINTNTIGRSVNSGRSENLGRNTNFGKDDIIDAEFVEKK